jgi:hypothetical protein
MEFPLGGLQPTSLLSRVFTVAHQIRMGIGCSLRNRNSTIKNFSDIPTVTRLENT